MPLHWGKAPFSFFYIKNQRLTLRRRGEFFRSPVSGGPGEFFRPSFPSGTWAEKIRGPKKSPRAPRSRRAKNSPLRPSIKNYYF